MHQRIRHIKRHYKKLAAALAGAACISAAVIHGVPAPAHLTMPTAKPLASRSATQPTQAKAPAGEKVSTVPPTRQPVQVSTPPAKKSAPEPKAARGMDMTATAYAPGPQDNDQWDTKTRMGTEVRPGIIAVDPRVIPLGSRVMIKYPNGHTEYAVAEDTGGAIKGHRIDVAKWTVAEANRFGIKPVKVYVLETPTERTWQGT
jgi:3D (Asp-Asp-Asp) domain-containing protein